MGVKIRLTNGVLETIPHHPIDSVGVSERAASFTKRSLKKGSKLEALKTMVAMMDLTTLEGADTPERVRQLCGRARQPLPAHLDELVGGVPPVAAVCVYPALVPVAVEFLAETSVQVASVSTAFPSSQVSGELKLLDVQQAVSWGATEIDMVISRNAFLRGDYQTVYDEIVKVKEACGTGAHLKVILETGELGTLDQVYRASKLAILAGADFIKTSTGKVQPGATLPVTLVMLQSIFDHFQQSGQRIGMKPAGGVRTAKEAIAYLCMVYEVLGVEWLTPTLFRFGASRLLNDVLRQILRQVTGSYYNEEVFGSE